MNETQIIQIREHVKNLVNKYNTNNPLELCHYLNIDICHKELIDTRGFYMSPLGFPIITLDINLNHLTEKFVCAHELGHHLFDDGLNKTFLDTHTYMIKDRFENRADTFASQLLWGISNNQEIESITEWQLADCLNIAKCNINERLLELGIY